MKVTAMLADHVQEANGKLYINGGGWNVWWTQSAPFTVPALGIAILVSVPYTATNQVHRFVAAIENEDGARIPLPIRQAGSSDEQATSVEGEFNVGRPPHLPPGEEQIVPIAINLPALVLPAFGAYSLVVELDGNEEGRLSFRLAPPLGLHSTQ